MVEMKGLVLAGVAVIALSLIVLTGLVVIDQYSLVLRQSNTSTFPVGPLAATNVSTALGAALSYPFPTAATPCINSTNGTQMPTNFYTFYGGANANGGTITLNDLGADWEGHTVNCTVPYRPSTTEQVQADKFFVGLAIFGTFMAVIVLSIIGVAIVSFFKKGSGE